MPRSKLARARRQTCSGAGNGRGDADRSCARARRQTVWPHAGRVGASEGSHDRRRRAVEVCEPARYMAAYRTGRHPCGAKWRDHPKPGHDDELIAQANFISASIKEGPRLPAPKPYRWLRTNDQLQGAADTDTMRCWPAGKPARRMQRGGDASRKGQAIPENRNSLRNRGWRLRAAGAGRAGFSDLKRVDYLMERANCMTLPPLVFRSRLARSMSWSACESSESTSAPCSG